MSGATGDWVPKVHPATRAVEPEDPMEMIATPVVGDPDVMFECLVQEFIGMGWGLAELVMLFRSPGYPLLNELLSLYGEDQVRERIQQMLSRSGTLRFREVIVDEPDGESDEPELVQLNLRKIEKDPSHAPSL